MSDAEQTIVETEVGLTPQAQKILRVLQDANGGVVDQDGFARALYANPDKRPASSAVVCRAIVRQLRVKGYQIENKRSAGYRLLTPGH